MKVKRDQITGSILILFGICVLVLIQQFQKNFSLSYPGPKFVPACAAIGFLICGSGIFIESSLNKKEEKKFLVKDGWMRMFVSVCILCLYVLAMKYFGYLVCTPIFTYAIVTLFAREKKTTLIGRIFFSLSVSFIVYAVYVFAFGMSLPVGLVFD
ncbi:MAG: tripartite tricarboxylate transporter TctB family protein [Spirochaetia bacterium]|jgi:hypothetical protein|nr:tripartite tricarboxylate transporter TctB family protein [Spirochaetia bacterium]